MLIFIVSILCISFFFYTIFGGADFGAGVLELFTGNRSIRPIYKAISPVWEANHIWLILAVVIIFNGFPAIYAEMSTSLHIPLFIILIGIVVRGTAFTFRHYDAIKDESQKAYNFFFRFSSILTCFFLGITLGAMMFGQITDSTSVSFPERFIYSWLNPFCMATGVFSTALFGYLASIYIIGETITEEEKKYFSKIAIRFGFATFISGAAVLLLGLYSKAAFMDGFFHSPLSITAFILATLLIPLIIYSIKQEKILVTRISVVMQTGCIMAGWVAKQMPVVLYMKDGNHLSIYNAAAGTSTLYYLTVALIIGALIIFPCLYYLFFIFKIKNSNNPDI